MLLSLCIAKQMLSHAIAISSAETMPQPSVNQPIWHKISRHAEFIKQKIKLDYKLARSLLQTDLDRFRALAQTNAINTWYYGTYSEYTFDWCCARYDTELRRARHHRRELGRTEYYVYVIQAFCDACFVYRNTMMEVFDILGDHAAERRKMLRAHHKNDVAMAKDRIHGYEPKDNSSKIKYVARYERVTVV